MCYLSRPSLTHSLLAAGAGAAAAAGPGAPDVDLSQLSEEERAIIESVMEKAKEMEGHETPTRR